MIRNPDRLADRVGRRVSPALGPQRTSIAEEEKLLHFVNWFLAMHGLGEPSAVPSGLAGQAARKFL